MDVQIILTPFPIICTGTAFSGDHSDVWAYNKRNELDRSDRFDDITVPLTDNRDNTKDFAYTYDNIGNREDCRGPAKVSGPERDQKRWREQLLMP